MEKKRPKNWHDCFDSVDQVVPSTPFRITLLFDTESADFAVSCGPGVKSKEGQGTEVGGQYEACETHLPRVVFHDTSLCPHTRFTETPPWKRSRSAETRSRSTRHFCLRQKMALVSTLPFSAYMEQGTAHAAGRSLCGSYVD